MVRRFEKIQHLYNNLIIILRGGILPLTMIFHIRA